MIYNSSFLKKELKESYFEQAISMKNRYSFALFLALLSFGVHSIMLTLKASVLADELPHYLYPSYFSILSIYNDIAYFFYIVYLTSNYHELTFAEIKNNKWYILMKFGFSPVRMIFTKLYVRLLTAFIVYSLGYLIIMFLGTFLKYPFVFIYVLPLFILGFLDIIFIITVTMTSSLYFEKGKLSGYVMFLSVVLLSILKKHLGYYSIIRDISKFTSFFVFRYFLEYILTVFIIISLCLITIFIRAKINAKFYYFSFYKRDLDFPTDVKIVLNSNTKRRRKKLKEYSINNKNKILSRLTNIFLSLIIVMFIIINIIVLIVSVSTPGKELFFIKVIPYVFKSDTMEPAIMYNDLVFFKKTDIDEPLKTSDTVLYQGNGMMSISRIQSFEDEKIIVDIDNYPSENEINIYKEAINRTQIYGKYIGRSRWLGVLILFANTTLGRLLLLLIPSILLFYYKSIARFISLIRNERLKE